MNCVHIKTKKLWTLRKQITYSCGHHAIGNMEKWKMWNNSTVSFDPTTKCVCNDFKSTWTFQKIIRPQLTMLNLYYSLFLSPSLSFSVSLFRKIDLKSCGVIKLSLYKIVSISHQLKWVVLFVKIMCLNANFLLSHLRGKRTRIHDKF